MITCRLILRLYYSLFQPVAGGAKWMWTDPPPNQQIRRESDVTHNNVTQLQPPVAFFSILISDNDENPLFPPLKWAIPQSVSDVAQSGSSEGLGGRWISVSGFLKGFEEPKVSQVSLFLPSHRRLLRPQSLRFLQIWIMFFWDMMSSRWVKLYLGMGSNKRVSCVSLTIQVGTCYQRAEVLVYFLRLVHTRCGTAAEGASAPSTYFYFYIYFSNFEMDFPSSIWTLQQTLSASRLSLCLWHPKPHPCIVSLHVWSFSHSHTGYWQLLWWLTK